MPLFCDAEGCGYEAANAASLGRHRNTQCKFRVSGITSILEKRKAEVEDIREFKRARTERQREHEKLVEPVSVSGQTVATDLMYAHTSRVSILWRVVTKPP